MLSSLSPQYSEKPRALRQKYAAQEEESYGASTVDLYTQDDITNTRNGAMHVLDILWDNSIVTVLMQ